MEYIYDKSGMNSGLYWKGSWSGYYSDLKGSAIKDLVWDDEDNAEGIN